MHYDHYQIYKRDERVRYRVGKAHQDAWETRVRRAINQGVEPPGPGELNKALRINLGRRLTKGRVPTMAEIIQSRIDLQNRFINDVYVNDPASLMVVFCSNGQAL